MGLCEFPSQSSSTGGLKDGIQNDTKHFSLFTLFLIFLTKIYLYLFENLAQP